MKRIVSMLMAVVILLTLAACGGGKVEESTDSTTTTTTTAETVVNTSVTERTTTTTQQHVHQYFTKKISPTCESQGYTQYICSCGNTYKDNYINATGHKWKDATCTSAKICETCGETIGEPLTHNYKKGVCVYCDCYDYVYVELAQDAFEYMKTKYNLTTYDVISIDGGEIDGSPAIMFYYGYIKYFTYNEVTGRVTAWPVGNVEFVEHFSMNVKEVLGE